MDPILALCARVNAATDRIESQNAGPKDSAIEQAIRDLRWAEHNIRNQTAAMEQELQSAKQTIARLESLLSRPGR